MHIKTYTPAANRHQQTVGSGIITWPKTGLRYHIYVTWWYLSQLHLGDVVDRNATAFNIKSKDEGNWQIYIIVNIFCLQFTQIISTTYLKVKLKLKVERPVSWQVLVATLQLAKMLVFNLSLHTVKVQVDPWNATWWSFFNPTQWPSSPPLFLSV